MKNNIENCKIKKLFVATTPYHVLVSCNLCDKEDIIICAGQFKIDGFTKTMIDQSFEANHCFITEPFQYYKEKPYRLLLFKSNMKKLVHNIRNRRFCEIYVFNDVDPIVQWILKFIESQKKIVIEEGIGLYRDTVKRREHFFRYFGKPLFGMHFENLKRIGESTLITEIQCKHAEKLSTIQSNKNVVGLKDISYKDLAKRLNIDQTTAKYWFIGQPLVEDGVITQEKYIEFITNLISIIKESGEECVIKPHPRENIQKYKAIKEMNCAILNDITTPIEILINTEVEPNVFTIYSSAILTIGRIKNVKCISLIDLMKFDFPLENIRKMFDEEGILLPSSWREVLLII